MFNKSLETSLNFLAEPFGRQVIKPGTHIAIVGTHCTGRSRLALHIARDLALNNALEEGVTYMQDEGSREMVIDAFQQSFKWQLLQMLPGALSSGQAVIDSLKRYEPKPVTVLDLMTVKNHGAAAKAYEDAIKNYCVETGSVLITTRTVQLRMNVNAPAPVTPYIYDAPAELEADRTVVLFTGRRVTREDRTETGIKIDLTTHKDQDAPFAGYTIDVPVKYS